MKPARNRIVVSAVVATVGLAVMGGVAAEWRFTGEPASASAVLQVDTIRPGDPALRGAHPREGSYVIESFRRADGEDTPMSVTTQTVTAERRDGRAVHVIRSVHISAESDTTTGTIVVDAADLSLIHHRVKAARDSAAVTAASGYLTGWVALPGEAPLLVDRRLDRAVFPVEGPEPWLFPLLPLAPGYEAAVPHFSQWSGTEEWAMIRVIGEETLTLAGRTLDCWKVDGGEAFPGYTATYWVDRATRRVVRSVARGGAGAPEYWSVLR